jgi:hypothetical protein
MDRDHELLRIEIRDAQGELVEPPEGPSLFARLEPLDGVQQTAVPDAVDLTGRFIGLDDSTRDPPPVGDLVAVGPRPLADSL